MSTPLPLPISEPQPLWFKDAVIYQLHVKTFADSNGDGILSADEHEAGSKRMFEKMDKDRDGTLTAAEISAGHKTMMKKTN